MVDELPSRAEAVVGRVQAVSSLCAQYQRHMDLLEQLLRRTTEMVRRMEHFMRTGLRELGFFILEEKALGRFYCGL